MNSPNTSRRYCWTISTHASDCRLAARSPRSSHTTRNTRAVTVSPFTINVTSSSFGIIAIYSATPKRSACRSSDQSSRSSYARFRRALSIRSSESSNGSTRFASSLIFIDILPALLLPVFFYFLFSYLASLWHVTPFQWNFS